MRPLVMDFPKIRKSLGIGNQYSFGPAIMVTPVTSAGATTQSVYLPAAGAALVQLLDGANFACRPARRSRGSRRNSATIHPSGSIIPMGPFLQYSSEKPADPIELRIYRGADGKFTLYEDEGDSYNYEEGEYSTIPFSWNDAGHTLEIGKRSGEFPGMLKEPHVQHRLGFGKPRRWSSLHRKAGCGCSLYRQTSCDKGSVMLIVKPMNSMMSSLKIGKIAAGVAAVFPAAVGILCHAENPIVQTSFTADFSPDGV